MSRPSSSRSSSSRRVSSCSRNIPSILSRKRKREEHDAEMGVEPEPTMDSASTSAGAVPTTSAAMEVEEASGCQQSQDQAADKTKDSGIHIHGHRKSCKWGVKLKAAYDSFDRLKFGVALWHRNPVDRKVPLPELRWADKGAMWQGMCSQERDYPRDANLFHRHPELQPRMRSILLDWLTEVCEVYRMHRQTFQRAMDYLDRFLSRRDEVQKQSLQLLGITCLFMAAKIEEIYPPKIVDFAYVTDGACTEQEILVQELIVMKALDWMLEPVTIHEWLSLYLEILSGKEEEEEMDLSESDSDGQDLKRPKTKTMMIPSYSIPHFLHATQLGDLCILDAGSLQFRYSLLAAACVYFACGKDASIMASGYEWEEISRCVHWMAPFATTFKTHCVIELKEFPQLPKEELPLIQTHAFDLDVLTQAQELQSRTQYGSPTVLIPGLLTPPHSTQKDSRVKSFGQELPPLSSSLPTPPPSWTQGLPLEAPMRRMKQSSKQDLLTTPTSSSMMSHESSPSTFMTACSSPQRPDFDDFGFMPLD